MGILVSAVESKGESSEAGVRRKYPRSLRLLRHADFERVYQQGRRHFSAHITVFYFRRQDEKSARVGYTVSRALGGAVDRNRMKRRLREAVRLSWKEMNAVDIVINPKKSLLQAGFEDLKKEIERAFEVIRKGQRQ